MSKTNSTVTTNEETEKVAEVVEKVVEKKPETLGPVAAMTAETQRMNARQFFETYPHDNKQVVALIIMLYPNTIKTVAQWEAFYQQMLKKKVS